MSFDLFTLPNGLKVVGERMPHARSASIGLYIGIGSQYEPLKYAGASHFIEHMVFKGTVNRTAKQIAIEMDRIGGQINAYTAKECTCFYTRTLQRHLSEAIEVVFDLALNPRFAAEELEKEKGVVLEEIAMAEDDPEDLVHEILMPAHFGRQRVARPILGTAKKIEAYTADDLRAFHDAYYRPRNAVFSIAGSYDPEQLKDLLERVCQHWSEGAPILLSAEPKPPIFGSAHRSKQTEQTHICLGFPGLPLRDIETYELSLISTVYGGAMSSRLFQKIREELGLAYSVYSEQADYTDCGLLSVYAAVNPEAVERVYREICELTHLFVRDGMTMDEFRMAKEQLTTELMLGGESTSSRMQANGRRLLLLDTVKSEEEILAQLDRTSYESTNDLLRRLLDSPHSLAVVGRNAKNVCASLR